MGYSPIHPSSVQLFDKLIGNEPHRHKIDIISVTSMKLMVGFGLSVVLSICVTAIAILSVQNATLVTLQFLVFQSIQLPLGVLLAFCMGGGMLIMAAVQTILTLKIGKRVREQVR